MSSHHGALLLARQQSDLALDNPSQWQQMPNLPQCPPALHSAQQQRVSAPTNMTPDNRTWDLRVCHKRSVHCKENSWNSLTYARIDSI